MALRRVAWGVLVPLLLVVLILGADLIEGPKTAFVGVLTVVPMLSAVFAAPSQTFFVGVVTWCAAFAFGHVAADGNVAAQTVRLVIIAATIVVATAAAGMRDREVQRIAADLSAAELRERLRQQAQRDPVTGLLNRTGLLAALEESAATDPRSIAIIDCDDLKGVNDRLGHLGGDAYLRAIAGRISNALPEGDHVARWGSDEFLVVQALTVEQAQIALQRVSERVQETPLRIMGEDVVATVSIGLTRWNASTPLDQVLVIVDRALYEAQATGRNRIVVA